MESNTAKITAFNDAVEKSDDLHDELQNLTDYLAEFTRATAVYVGKVDKPILGISSGLPEDCSPDAHIIKNAIE
jgi:hypothetical protein